MNTSIALAAIFSLAILIVSACSDDGLGNSSALPTQSGLTTAGDALQEKLQDQIPQGTPAGHGGDEGLVLGKNAQQESVYKGITCEPSAPVRNYDVVAINLEITLNRYMDYDPLGRMYALQEDLNRVRNEETTNREARNDISEPAVSLGLQGDAIQPLVLRVNQGECLQIALTNEMTNGEAASLHIHGSGLYLPLTGKPAIATNPNAYVDMGQQVTYQWWVPATEPEGTHYFHSHGNTREQTSHGLFGAVIVEPKDSRHLDPVTGAELRSGWASVIQDPGGSDFREYAIIYHEIGNEAYSHLNKDGQAVPLVDTFTSAYKPGGRALNYRSEPFLNRMKLQHDTTGNFDQSLAYSSYAFGDPATPVARAYLGDPVKQRVVHGGSEVFHVHHVHGGATRWSRQPQAEPVRFDTGFLKRPPLLPVSSSRIDSQAVGPSENYDVENECGSGGCQQSVGDYLVHCHVAQHSVAGMWMIWRVYNTLQDGNVSQDSLPALMELPDRRGSVRPGVPSDNLLGKTVNWSGEATVVNSENLAALVEQQLPPKGVPNGYDATVLDWKLSQKTYLNQPDDERVWPGYASAIPGERQTLHFNPDTGKLAYPYLKPHLGQRPPFAPNHGPAPYLSPVADERGPPTPGSNGPRSLCPSDTDITEFNIHAITLPIVINQRADLVDPSGQLFVLKEQEDAVRADNDMRVPLAIRAKASEDCVDVVFKSELKDDRENAFFSKVSIHIHFAQFDVLGSDGVTTGFNFEQSVRPFAVEGETLSSNAAVGDLQVLTSNSARFQTGTLVGIGMDQEKTFETRRIAEIAGDTLVFDSPLEFEHSAGEYVSVEFLRYRWFPDVQFGTAYFHDHVNALTSWKHGLFGALIAEPPGSTFHSPETGDEIRSGPKADVHTSRRTSFDIAGSFRELVLFIQDDNLFTRFGSSSGSSINLRAEPLESRPGDPASLFSSSLHGDPETPILESYLGDPIVIRGLVAATNDVHTLHVDGHWFRAEPHSGTSPPINTAKLGISERFDMMIPAAGGPQGMPGDYLYYNGRIFKFREGSWGIIRVWDQPSSSLKPLPDRETTPTETRQVCPDDSPRKAFDVVAMEIRPRALGSGLRKMFVLKADQSRAHSLDYRPEPLVLHVNVGDCIQVNLQNETGGHVSLHADMLAFDPKDSYGVDAGYGTDQTVAPDEQRTYTYFAHPEIGETVAMLRDWANVLENPRLGLYGAIVVGPRNAVYSHPATGEDMSANAGWRVDVHPATGESYRDFTLFIQDEDEIIGTHIMPYAEDVQGMVGLNYFSEPLTDKGGVPSFGDIKTPTLQAYVGERVKIHVLAPYSEQAHVFSVENHRWPLEPGLPGSDLLSSQQSGSLETITIELSEGAGGPSQMPGDYVYGDHRQPYTEAGLWGILEVYAEDDLSRDLRRLLDP